MIFIGIDKCPKQKKSISDEGTEKVNTIFVCVESESTKTPAGKATAENPFDKFL
jgi:hypothetical protein